MVCVFSFSPFLLLFFLVARAAVHPYPAPACQRRVLRAAAPLKNRRCEGGRGPTRERERESGHAAGAPNPVPACPAAGQGWGLEAAGRKGRGARLSEPLCLFCVRVCAHYSLPLFSFFGAAAGQPAWRDPGAVSCCIAAHMRGGGACAI
eukprot:TRINITY_DN2494_c2_g1_i1.p1 TRINITY_DN2494_c2_g1~~TRINITY_DN2494_c2_g1_i1.p1  ORF type:complete len:149 (-),score=0.44 TRINITY_DN2494_c2_g1_i1:646-1092(-)